jgi:hydroxymethylglutaryl-CoA lyase
MKIIECPRDAMQGLEKFIPTKEKVAYVNQLLKVGFDTIDVGSFVSPKAIPQLRDTAQMLERIHWQSSLSALLIIVANIRGAEQASSLEAVRYIGFPLSMSETFQQRNTNRSISEALNTVNEIQEIFLRTGKVLVTYISMGFGNPYGDPYNPGMVGSFIEVLASLDVKIVSLADTVGVSTPEQIRFLFSSLTKSYPALELGVHLHSHPAKAQEKIEAAWEAGCRRLDGALRGFGGCPMAEDELVGNLATEKIIAFLDEKKEALVLNRIELQQAMALADTIFSSH